MRSGLCRRSLGCGRTEPAPAGRFRGRRLPARAWAGCGQAGLQACEGRGPPLRDGGRRSLRDLPLKRTADGSDRSTNRGSDGNGPPAAETREVTTGPPTSRRRRRASDPSLAFATVRHLLSHCPGADMRLRLQNSAIAVSCRSSLRVRASISPRRAWASSARCC